MTQQLHLEFFPSSAFYNSPEWIALRWQTLSARGWQCEACGATRSKKHNVFLQVDHIVPRYIDPSRSLDPTNLQVLCYRCNHGKSTRIVDFRHVVGDLEALNQDYAEYERLEHP